MDISYDALLTGFASVLILQVSRLKVNILMKMFRMNLEDLN